MKLSLREFSLKQFWMAYVMTHFTDEDMEFFCSDTADIETAGLEEALLAADYSELGSLLMQDKLQLTFPRWEMQWPNTPATLSSAIYGWIVRWRADRLAWPDLVKHVFDCLAAAELAWKDGNQDTIFSMESILKIDGSLALAFSEALSAAQHDWDTCDDDWIDVINVTRHAEVTRRTAKGRLPHKPNYRIVVTKSETVRLSQYATMVANRDKKGLVVARPSGDGFRLVYSSINLNLLAQVLPELNPQNGYLNLNVGEEELFTTLKQAVRQAPRKRERKYRPQRPRTKNGPAAPKRKPATTPRLDDLHIFGETSRRASPIPILIKRPIDILSDDQRPDANGKYKKPASQTLRTPKELRHRKPHHTSGFSNKPFADLGKLIKAK
jgi:hypothetical protein